MGYNTKGKKFDGQKQEIEGSLVARRFQEQNLPLSESPKMLRESLKMHTSGARNEGFGLRNIYIRAGFLQTKGLDKKVDQNLQETKKGGSIMEVEEAFI